MKLAISNYADTSRELDFLALALQHPESRVRASTVQDCGKSRNPQAANILIPVLQDPVATVRVMAARALGQLGDSHAVEPLITALQAPDHQVARAAAISLGLLGERQAIVPLLHTVTHTSIYVQEASLSALQRLLGPASPILPQRGRAHAEVLRDNLLCIFEWITQVVRRYAILCGGRQRDRRLRGLLLRALRDSDPRVRECAARALAEVCDRQAIPMLLEALGETDASARRAIVRALGKLGDGRLVAPIIHALREAYEALPPLDDSNWQSIQSQYYELDTLFMQTLADLRKLSLISLFPVLQDNHAFMRDWAIRALGMLVISCRARSSPRDSEVLVLALLPMLEDSDAFVRYAAVEVLGRLADKRAVPHLTQKLWDADSLVRNRAVQALHCLADPRAVPSLLQMLQTQNEQACTRAAAARALATIGGSQVLEPLVMCLDDASSDVRAAAASSLGSIGDRRAVCPLVRRLKAESNRLALFCMVNAVGELNDPTVAEDLLVVLDREDDHARRRAIELLHAWHQLDLLTHVT